MIAMRMKMSMWPFRRIIVWLILELNVLEDYRFSSVVRCQFLLLLYNDYRLILQPKTSLGLVPDWEGLLFGYLEGID